MFLLLLLAFVTPKVASVSYQSLDGTAWSVSGNIPPSDTYNFLPQATVPGCIHLDWMRGKNETQKFYYRFNDDQLDWIAKSNWKYTLHFKPDDVITNAYEQWLIFEGLDTIANITLNDIEIGRTSDMFQVYRFNVSSLLQYNYNVLEVSFESAISFTNTMAASQKYNIPPSCPPDVQHGFCHVNLIRKEQCSFSWDWGPAFASQGIWKPVYLISLNYAVINDATATFDWSRMDLEVDILFQLVMFAEDWPLYGNVTIEIKELNLIKLFVNVKLPRSNNELTVKTFVIDFDEVKFEKWWPNGYGLQKLYNISVSFSSLRGHDKSTKHFMFGFRKIELVQEPIAGSKGLSFYFKVNDVAVFAKGANWIPADAFKSRITYETYERLLQSAADAHMNMLRVWGGGIYEDSFFYETADRLGIMLWQDFMFACALYPSTQNFLSNVTMEVANVMWKLRHHPSIVIWAGNNENEAALSTDWYNTTAHFDRYKKDYVDLYIDTIEPKVKEMDRSRPFVSSSPSNGKETVSEGGLAKNPYDPNYGDVHYYNYNDDCLDWTKYPATRFASEYGFQSWPSFETIRPVTIEVDRSIDSLWAKHRQHHPDGNKQMLDQIAMHFKMPSSTNPSHYFLDILYLTQIMQALCYKSQTEFYRRSRNETIKGAGHTMGALYWQLNDIWQAPSWSSIEYGVRWKALHYFAMQFFSPVSLIAYSDDSTMKVYVASDESRIVEGTLIVTVHSWDSFIPLGTFNTTISVQPYSSSLVYQKNTGYLLDYGGCPDEKVCYLTLQMIGGPSVPTNYFFPVQFKNIEHLHEPKFEIKDVTKSDNEEFDVTIITSTPALFVWINSHNIKGRFSENAFVMSEPIKVVKFYSWTPYLTSDELQKTLTIRSLNDLMETPEDPTKSPPAIDRPPNITWLENDTIKLTVAVIGLLFLIMSSSMVICVVLRLNKPTYRPYNSRIITEQSYRNTRFSTNSIGNNNSWSSEMSSFYTDPSEEATGFLIRTKNGSNEKKTEFRFYII